MLTVSRVIKSGEELPRWYGIGRYLSWRGAIIYPIPLNILVRLWDKFVSWLRMPPTSPREDEVIKLLADARNETWKLGYRAGRDDAYREIWGEIESERRSRELGGYHQQSDD